MFNKVVSRFDPEMDMGCTFCIIVRNRNMQLGENIVEDETVHHLFWECEHIQRVLQFIKRGLNEVNMTRIDFLIGKEMNSYNRTMVRIFITHVARWYIYISSRVKKIPNEDGIRGAIRTFQDYIYKTKYREAYDTVWRWV
jgi:hypothetical protein